LTVSNYLSDFRATINHSILRIILQPYTSSIFLKNQQNTRWTEVLTTSLLAGKIAIKDLSVSSGTNRIGQINK